MPARWRQAVSPMTAEPFALWSANLATHCHPPPASCAPSTPAGALPGALQRDGGDVFEGPAPSTPGGASPQLASCFWFVSIEGTPPGSAASPRAGASQASSAPGAPRTPGGSLEAPPVRTLQAFASKAVPAQLEGLNMGPLIGSGSFGRGETACCQEQRVWLGIHHCRSL